MTQLRRQLRRRMREVSKLLREARRTLASVLIADRSSASCVCFAAHRVAPAPMSARITVMCGRCRRRRRSRLRSGRGSGLRRRRRCRRRCRRVRRCRSRRCCWRRCSLTQMTQLRRQHRRRMREVYGSLYIARRTLASVLIADRSSAGCICFAAHRVAPAVVSARITVMCGRCSRGRIGRRISRCIGRHSRRCIGRRIGG